MPYSKQDHWLDASLIGALLMIIDWMMDDRSGMYTFHVHIASPAFELMICNPTPIYEDA